MLSALIPAGPRDPTPDPIALERERVALGETPENSSLRNAILAEANAILKSKVFHREWEKIGHVTLLLEPFTIENGLLTMTLKMKRDAVGKRFSSDINKMFGRSSP